jgi:peptide-methionine (R)-S-oxide reductase
VSQSNNRNDRGKHLPGRRRFLLASGVALPGLALSIYRFCYPSTAAAASRGPKQVKIVDFTDAGERKGAVLVLMIQKTDAEWKTVLSPAAFEVTRREGTERPFTGANLNIHDKGIFRCICCDTALFSSDTKFESGTGWPSFWAPIAKENVSETLDASLGMTRTAVSCRRCEAHLGHVFDDGPKPTGLRYCMNSVALRFAKAS